MQDIAGIPYIEVKFDKNGSFPAVPTLTAGVTDLLVISHGWNNDEADARTLYTKLFQNFVALAKPGDLPNRSIAILGVIWPSKKFDELVAVASAPGSVSGSAGLGRSDTESVAVLQKKLDAMREFFTEPEQQSLIEEARALLPDLEEKGSARREFVAKIRQLLNPEAAEKEDASTTFFKEDGNDLMERLRVDEEDLDEEVATPGGIAAIGVGSGPHPTEAEGAVGLKSFLSGFKASAMNILNYTTYFEMKARAGTVGKNGVARVIDHLAPSVQAIHLIGHSFGGRVVTSAAFASKTDKIKSMTLLQAAFSHNGFSRSMHGAFRIVVDNTRVHGPILVTYTKNDKAVGIAYPLASRISGDKTAAFGDETDVFGGIGRNGAQLMEKGETVKGRLLGIGSAYAFTANKVFNLEASEFISDHNSVTGKEIAYALRKVIAG